MPKLLNIISYITLIVAFLMIFVSTYWFVYPYKPVEFKNLPHKVDSKQVKSGEYLTMEIEYCKYSNIVPEISTSFVDGLIYYVPETANPNVIKIGCGINKIFIYIPKSLPPGKYTANRVWKYHVNPLRIMYYYTHSESFEVIK
jgi:hypothetical protein